MSKTKKLHKLKIRKHTKTYEKIRKNTKCNKVRRSRCNLRKTHKGGLKIIPSFINRFFEKRNATKTVKNNSFTTPDYYSYMEPEDMESNDLTENDNIDEKTRFLMLLDNCRTSINDLDLSDLDHDTSEKIKTFLIGSISKLYDYISTTEMSKLKSIKVRTIAGTVLTKTLIIQLFSNCPECPKIKISDPNKKSEIISKIDEIIKIPYIGFTQFEKAIKTEEAKRPDQDQDSDSDSDTDD